MKQVLFALCLVLAGCDPPAAPSVTAMYSHNFDGHRWILAERAYAHGGTFVLHHPDCKCGGAK